MSHKASNWAFDQQLEPRYKIILLALADYADADGYCYPGQQALVRRCSMSESTLRRGLKYLEEIGLISRERRNSENGQRKTDGYQLNPETPPVNLTGSLPVKTGQNRGGYPSTVTGTRNRQKNRQEEPPETIEKFEEFWDIWPRPVGKPKALLAFQAALKDRRATADQIIAAAIAYRDHPYRPQAQYVPHPTTWLHRDGWNDELPPAPAPTGPVRAPSGGVQLPAAPRYPVAKAPTDDWVIPFPEPVA